MSAKSAVAHSTMLPYLQGMQRPGWLTSASLLIADVIALSSVFWLAVTSRLVITHGDLSFYLGFYPGIVLFVGAFWLQGLYPGLLLHPAEELRRTCSAVTVVFLLVACSTFVLHNAQWYSRSIFLITWAAGMPVVLLVRHLARVTLGKNQWWGIRAVVLGSGPAAQRIIRALRDERLGVRVTGVLGDEPPTVWSPDLPPFLGDFTSAPHIAGLRLANYAIVAVPEKSYSEVRHLIQDHCRGFSHVLLVPDMYGLCSLGVITREIRGEVGFELPQKLFHRNAAITKRALDFVLTAIVMMLIAPLFFLISLTIKLTSRGPVFYGHPRYGRDGREFKALKFRTMVQNGDAVLAEYFRSHPSELLAWERDHKLKLDPRVTAVGKWLRRYSLDELPQLCNVALGHMSLVGPRPIVTAEIPKYGRGYNLYTRVAPGITGLWQVSGRNNTTYEERVAFDEYYVRNWSIWLDAYILVRTVKVILTAEGAY